jgi:hypothetical protein
MNRKENALEIDFPEQYAHATWHSTSHETSDQSPCDPCQAVEACEEAHDLHQEQKTERA